MASQGPHLRPQGPMPRVTRDSSAELLRHRLSYLNTDPEWGDPHRDEGTLCPYWALPEPTGLRLVTNTWERAGFDPEELDTSPFVIQRRSDGKYARVTDVRVAEVLKRGLCIECFPQEESNGPHVLLMGHVAYRGPDRDHLYPRDPRDVWLRICGRAYIEPFYCQRLCEIMDIPDRSLITDPNNLEMLKNRWEEHISLATNWHIIPPNIRRLDIFIYITQALRLALMMWKTYGDARVAPKQRVGWLQSALPEMRWDERKYQVNVGADNSGVICDQYGVPNLLDIEWDDRAHSLRFLSESIPQISDEAVDALMQPQEALMRDRMMLRHFRDIGPNSSDWHNLLTDDLERYRLDWQILVKKYSDRLQHRRQMGLFNIPQVAEEEVRESDKDECQEGGQEDQEEHHDDQAPSNVKEQEPDDLIDDDEDAIFVAENVLGVEFNADIKRKALSDISDSHLTTSTSSSSSTSLQGAGKGKGTEKLPTIKEQGKDLPQGLEAQAGPSTAPLKGEHKGVHVRPVNAFRRKKPAAEYVPEIKPPKHVPSLLDYTPLPVYDSNNRPSSLNPPFRLISIEEILASSSQWQGLLDSNPDYAELLRRLGVNLPKDRPENADGTRDVGQQLDISTEDCDLWLRDPNLKGRLASHGIFLPVDLLLSGDRQTRIKAIHNVRRSMILKANEHLVAMKVRDANVLDDPTDITTQDLANVDFTRDYFNGWALPLPPVVLPRIINFLSDGDVDRIIGWKTAVNELKKYLQHLLPMSEGMKWGELMRRAARQIVTHEVFEWYFYGTWDRPLGVNTMERHVRLKAPPGAPEVEFHRSDPKTEAGPPITLLHRSPKPLSDVCHADFKDKDVKRYFYPYLRVLARHESALWTLTNRRKMTQEQMNAWLLEHKHIDGEALNPSAANAALIENDMFEECILKGPKHTVSELCRSQDPTRIANDDILSFPLTKIAAVRGSIRAGLQQCLQQVDHTPLKIVSTPWRRVNFISLHRHIRPSEDAGHVFQSIALKASTISENKKRHPFKYTIAIQGWREQVEHRADIIRVELDKTHEFLQGVAIYPEAREGTNAVRFRTARRDAREQLQVGRNFATRRARDEQTEKKRLILLRNTIKAQTDLETGRENDDQDDIQDPDKVAIELPEYYEDSGINLSKYTVKLPPNFHGPFLGSGQNVLQEQWRARLNELVKVFPVLLEAYKKCPRTLLHKCLEQIHNGMLTPEAIVEQKIRLTESSENFNREPTAAEMARANEVIQLKFEELVEMVSPRLVTDFVTVEDDDPKFESYPIWTTDNRVPKLVTDRNLQHLKMLAEPSRIPEAVMPLEPQHALFLSFWTRLSDIMYSPRVDNPWEHINSRVSAERVMRLVNEGPGAGTPTCHRFQFARSDVLHYLERLHRQRRIYYQHDDSIVGGWVLLPTLPEEVNETLYPETRFVWDTQRGHEHSQECNLVLESAQQLDETVNRLGAPEYPAAIDDWEAVLDARDKWVHARRRTGKRGKDADIRDFGGNRNFIVAPQTVDYFLSVSYRLGYTIRFLRQLLKNAPCHHDPWDEWGDNHVHNGKHSGDCEDPVPFQAVKARLDAWDAAVQASEQFADEAPLPTLRDVVRIVEPERWHKDMTELEARDLVRFKLVEEAQQSNTMLWPARKVTFRDGKTGQLKMALKRDDIWSWAHPAVHRNCGKRFFHLDRWPLEVLGPKEQRAVIDEERFLDHRLLFNPMEGDVPQAREHYFPTVYKKVTDEEKVKTVYGRPTYESGDTPLQRHFIEKTIEAMLAGPIESKFKFVCSIQFSFGGFGA